ncbi:MAG TPA: efflux RND transporter periplasmic adaptor subunit [Candidatus Acidoferrales bacterium]|nr:efflux RND transporter periplasmic adaptor subunit [Candidatus Acidoferrales bacterium]
MAQDNVGLHLPIGLRDRRVAIALLVILALVTAAIAARIVVTSSAAIGTIEASGTLEATESDVSPKVEGRLVDLRVEDGDAVKRGQVVAVMESVDPGLDLDQARANEAAAAAQVGVAQAAYDLQRVTYQTTLAQASEGVDIAHSRLGQATENYGINEHTATLDVDQAQSRLAATQSAYDRAKIDFDRARSLVSTGDVAQQQLDDATNAYNAASAQLQVAKDALAGAKANLRTIAVSRLEVAASREAHRQSIAALETAEAERRLVLQRRAELVAANAQLAQSRAALGLAQDHVRETKLLAPFDGFVISHNFEDGDLIEPGSAVLTVGDLVHPYAYVYIAESDLPRVKTGTDAQVSIDGIPGRTFEGTVTEISDTAEFTPENVQTKEERIEYLVFRIKIQFTDTTGLLKPGLPVDAVLHT